MDIAGELEAVIDLFGRLGIEVRQECLGGESGGLCAIREKRVVFLDLDADSASRLARCLQVLKSIPELDSVYVPPKLRESIDRAEA